MDKVTTIDNRTTDEIITQVGKIYIEGEINIVAVTIAPKKIIKAKTGKEIYTTSCTTCHAIGIAGAPKLGNKTDWISRTAQGIDGLLKVAINGKGAMPPRGACGDCSDAEIKDAIKYMLDALK